jgi:GNAT superfamily N-acetyltransferase
MEQVLQLYQLLAGPYPEEKDTVSLSADQAWQAITADDRQYLLAAEVAGRIIGTLTLIVIPNIGHGCKPWAAVENVVVDEEFRGQGIGSVLMAKATDLSRSVGCYKVVLSSNIVRREAHDFYRRLGWTESHVGFSLDIR